jgi:acyl-CoA dehydrogenase
LLIHQSLLRKITNLYLAAEHRVGVRLTVSPITTAAEHDVELNERDYPELRDAVSRVCHRFGSPYWQDLDAREAYPTEFVKALTEDGYLAVLIPEEYGGAGLPLRAAAVILEEIHASGGNAGACHAQMYTLGTLLRHGSLAQRAEYLPRIASGELRLQAFGVTEPTSGSDTTKLRTTAVRDGAEFVVNGQKVWTSRALHSDLMLLLARTTPVDQVRRKTDGLSVFLVDMRVARCHGLEIRPLRAMVNHNTTEVFFHDMRVPAANLIGEVDKGFKYILDGMNAERILVASESFGDGRWFIDKASHYAKERQVFGRPIGQNQGVQFPIARAYVQLRGAELVLRQACALFDEGKQCGPEANMAKLLNSEAAWMAGEACLQTHGGFGYAVEYDVERKWRETRLYQIAPISTNLILAYVGEHVLGMPRSY